VKTRILELQGIRLGCAMPMRKDVPEISIVDILTRIAVVDKTIEDGERCNDMDAQKSLVPSTSVLGVAARKE